MHISGLSYTLLCLFGCSWRYIIPEKSGGYSMQSYRSEVTEMYTAHRIGWEGHWQQFNTTPFWLVLPSGSTGPVMHQGSLTGLAESHLWRQTWLSIVGTQFCALMAGWAHLRLAHPPPYMQHPWYYRDCKKLSQKPAVNIGTAELAMKP